jgi:tRNA (guanine37-N1)-methyltransferase
MEIDIITLFPGMIRGYLDESMVGRARERGLFRADIVDLREYGQGKWRITDDRPFGGGAGMLLKPEPLCQAIDDLKRDDSLVVFMTPDGEVFDQEMAIEFSKVPHLILVSGHYEGIDQRVRETRIDREVTIGDYILTNGTLPAAVVVDAVVRNISGVLGDEKSLTQDSFQRNLLGFPQYTRPLDFEGLGVPEVLLSGNHGEIDRWREERRLEKTRERRPDLLNKGNLS